MNDIPEQDVVIFTEALGLPLDERAAFLERACAGDGELRRRVEAALEGYEQAGDFLEKPADGLPISPSPANAIGEQPGDRVGRYKLLQQIGEGGCGVVFMAEQEKPVRRRVALKVIKPGMDSKSVIARFEAERQALAMMDHPNIAHVFDAGTTGSGRPYFVMELVRGLKITDYCDRHSLSTAARLELFIQVCGAIQHAHQKGVIHRDIKPSNVLVSAPIEGKALPKIIDFGIAKATTGHRLTDKTLFTAFEMMIGTPAYMSPEQAELSSMDVDTRSDIYSLGVLLYELLTGTTPFDTQKLLKSGLDEVRRVIREQEPVRPSTRLSTMMEVDLSTVSLHRQAAPPKLIQEIRGDLDWIVMKSLEKDRTRRYATANALAGDVENYLAGDIILARPPSAFYKFGKLVKRNKVLFSAIGIIILLLLVALALRVVIQDRRVREGEHAVQLEMRAILLAHGQGKADEAVKLFHQGLAIRREYLGGDPPDAVELDTFLEDLRDLNKFEEAESILSEILTPRVLSDLSYTEYCGMVLDTLARGGFWKEAAGLQSILLERQPVDRIQYHTLAPLLVAATNLPDYRQLCQKIVSRFGGTTNAGAADQMAKDCLILPSSGVDLDKVAAMADCAVNNGKSWITYDFFRACKALAEYRQGHFESATNWATQAAANPFPYSRAEACAVLAMAQYRLKNFDAARAALDKCRQVVEDKMPKVGKQDLGSDWRDWIISHALLNEATGLVEGGEISKNTPAKK